VVIRVGVTRVVTWDHSKLGLGSTRPAD